jgi:hypothetical protein
MIVGELSKIVKGHVAKVNSLLIRTGADAADQILLIWPVVFDPFFADFPFRVVCRQQGCGSGLI